MDKSLSQRLKELMADNMPAFSGDETDTLDEAIAIIESAEADTGCSSCEELATK